MVFVAGSQNISTNRPGGFERLRSSLARIIHEGIVFVNNAPAGAASAVPAGFDHAAAAGLKASPERRRANPSGVEPQRADYSFLCE